MRKMLTLAAAAVAIAASPARAQQVTYDYDRSADFTAYRTYAWAPGAPTGDAMTDQRIVAAIEAQMAASGLVKAAPGIEPDVRVAFYVGVGRNLEVSTTGGGWVGWTGAGGRWGSARTSQVYTGVLGVELRDGMSGRAMWHGIVSRDLDPKASPEKREKNLNKAVEKLFQHYPTREKK